MFFIDVLFSLLNTTFYRGKHTFENLTKDKSGDKSEGRKKVTDDALYSLKESHSSYNAVFDAKKDLLRAENTYHWNNY
jgi:hypothetical protein